jgi:hypothetical protein
LKKFRPKLFVALLAQIDCEENEVVGRCVSIGPSFRYVLTKRDFTDVVRRVDETTGKVDPGKISLHG